MGIRVKFIVILVIAAIVPLGIALVAIWTVGARHYQEEKGTSFQQTAAHLAQRLDLVLDKQIEGFSDWVQLSPLRDRLAEINSKLPELSSA